MRLHLTTVCWSDNADPTSGSNQNQNNIWVFTLTLGSNSVKVGSKNTFVVSFGPKRSYHDSTFKLFRDDISRFNGPDS
eukprot:2061667-Ditylum_brightwellii.AAC.1